MKKIIRGKINILLVSGIKVTIKVFVFIGFTLSRLRRRKRRGCSYCFRVGTGRRKSEYN